jgi:hypothetical protein
MQSASFADGPDDTRSHHYAGKSKDREPTAENGGLHPP